MKNRERLLNTSDYDMLCSMNDRLLRSGTCIMMALIDANLVPIQCVGYARKCTDCIAYWLDAEERHCIRWAATAIAEGDHP